MTLTQVPEKMRLKKWAEIFQLGTMASVRNNGSGAKKLDLGYMGEGETFWMKLD
jgi:hypothetical protein